jgi:glutamine cyclotransferase
MRSKPVMKPFRRIKDQNDGSFPRKRESIEGKRLWTPAFAGVTAVMFMVAALLIGLPFTLGARDRPPVLQAGQDKVPIYGYRVLHVYPHDREAYTQGLIFSGGFLYESTGLNGASGVRKVSLKSGRVLQERRLAREHFGEGLAEWGDRLLQLTWRSNTGFIYDRSTLKARETFSYPGEGWGLTHDGVRLIMSDGTETLRFLDPRTLKESGRLTVRCEGVPLANLNELEFVEGEIFANVYMTDWIARISPKTGDVTGWIDLRGLLPEADRRIPVDALNGIAWDAGRKRLFVTGKRWPKLFEIELVQRRQS